MVVYILFGIYTSPLEIKLEAVTLGNAGNQPDHVRPNRPNHPTLGV